MSPLPFRTTTLTAHGAGSVAALVAPSDSDGFEPRSASTIAKTAATTTAANAASAATRRHGLARSGGAGNPASSRSEEHTSELQSHSELVCRLLLEKKKKF